MFSHLPIPAERLEVVYQPSGEEWLDSWTLVGPDGDPIRVTIPSHLGRGLQEELEAEGVEPSVSRSSWNEEVLSYQLPW